MYFAEGRCSIFRDKNRSPCMWYDSMLFVEKNELLSGEWDRY